MKKKERLYRAVTFLKREDLDFLDGLVKDVYFTYGVKIPRAKLIEKIVAECKDRAIENKKELIKRMLDGVGTRIERRKYLRLKRSLQIGVRKVESLEQYKNCVSENVSMGGLKIDLPFLDEPLSLNQPIELTLNSPEEGLGPIKAMGCIAWIKEKENNQGSEIGIRLTYIRKEDKERFTKYLTTETETKNKIKLNGEK